MKKLYFDITETQGCIGIFIKDAEVLPAGTTVYAMSVKAKNAEYKRYADEYDIHFIFDDGVPQPDFYAVPQVDILATDSEGGYIGTVGQLSDLESDAPICYIDRDKNCYLLAQNGAEFLEKVPDWKSELKPYDGIVLYQSKEQAKSIEAFVSEPGE